jgi:hypothetical protein
VLIAQAALLDDSRASSASVFMPNRFITMVGGQKPVNELCRQLKPINNVNHVQYGLWNKASMDVSITMMPPKANIDLSMDMGLFSCAGLIGD